MKQKFARTSLLIMLIVCVIGFALIFSSLFIGEKKGDAAMQANGGVIDTNQYYRIIDTTAANYKTAGFILALIGGSGMLLSGYA